MNSDVYRLVKCNNCNKEMEYDIYDSVNATYYPILKDKVNSHDLFILKCPNCGKIFYLSYPFTYKDIDSKYMIHYSNNENIEKQYIEFKELVENAKKEINKQFTEMIYRFRFVNEYEKLKEKIRIFDKDLDDRIIELYKYEFIVNGYDKELNILDDVLFVNVDGSSECLFILFEKDVIDNVRAISFDEMEYIRLQKEYENIVDHFDDLEIDLLWAQKVYNSVNNNS